MIEAIKQWFLALSPEWQLGTVVIALIVAALLFYALTYWMFTQEANFHSLTLQFVFYALFAVFLYFGIRYSNATGWAWTKLVVP
jgi:hypothetical protein